MGCEGKQKHGPKNEGSSERWGGLGGVEVTGGNLREGKEGKKETWSEVS